MIQFSFRENTLSAVVQASVKDASYRVKVPLLLCGCESIASLQIFISIGEIGGYNPVFQVFDDVHA